MPLKILMITNTFLPVMGGSEMRWHYVANHLAAQGARVTVFTRRRSQKKDFEAFTPIHYHLFRFPYFVWLGERSRLITALTYLFGGILLFFGQYDIVHANTLYPTGWIAYCLGKLFKKPVVVTVAGEDVNSVPQINYGILIQSPTARQRSMELVKHAAAVVGMSPSLCEAIQKLGAHHNVVLVPNGIDAGIIQKRYLHHNVNEFRLLAVARNHPVKNLVPIIRALELLRDESLHLTIIGKGVNRLQPLVKEKAIDHQVTLLEYVPQDDTIQLLAASDVLISNSLIEGAPQVVQQAVAMRKPVIVSDVPGHRDFVNAKNGLLTDPCSAEDIAQAIRVCLKAKQSGTLHQPKESNVHFIGWDEVAQLHIQLYERIIRHEAIAVNYSWYK